MDERTRARERLEAEAKRFLEAERAAAEHVQNQPREAARRLHTSSPAAFRAAMGGYSNHVLFVCVVLLLCVAPAAWSEEADEISRFWLRVVTAATAASVVLAIAWRWSASIRYRAWQALQPWPVVGFREALALNGSVRRVVVDITFAGESPPQPVVDALVRGRMPYFTSNDDVGIPATVDAHTGGFSVTTQLEWEGHNRPLHRFVTLLSRRVVRRLHAAYPVAAIGVSAHDLETFYVPSSD